ncbi:helix-turn-helix domain-containing protein [Neisseriaceae bacterium CLB008]
MITFSLEEASPILGAHPETLRRKCKSGEIRAFKSGRAWRIAKEALADYIKDKENERLQEVRAEGSKKCQSDYVTEFTISTLLPRQGTVLDDLLAPATRKRPKSCTIN